jgi:hypothetical protein
MTFIRKWLCTAALSFGLVVAATSSQAATFNIAFAQLGIGDASPDWFGTFEAPVAGGAVTSFSALIDGTTYSNFGTVPTYAPFPFGDFLDGLVTSDPVAGTSLGLQFYGTFPLHLWLIVTCSPSGCGSSGDIPQGTYTITPSAVPLPPALPLFVSGLIALGLAAKKRMRRN